MNLFWIEFLSFLLVLLGHNRDRNREKVYFMRLKISRFDMYPVP